MVELYTKTQLCVILLPLLCTIVLYLVSVSLLSLCLGTGRKKKKNCPIKCVRQKKDQRRKEVEEDVLQRLVVKS